ncbi:hypothetical protein V1512DRAFT_271293 [Lipomyces arxii]|uniref:uncharacterized protein n=1 Tax=Lipomyces arxii TaxID=56418 RepID=UPI0034CD3247
MDRKAPRSSRLGSHASTPYARSAGTSEAPRTPARARDTSVAQNHGTPGTIFSKMISMFTPSRWTRNETEGVSGENGLGEEREINKELALENGNTQALQSNGLDSPTKYLPFLFSPAKQSATPVRSAQQSFTFTPVVDSDAAHLQSVVSPNQKLAQFFQMKGSAPLSDIEMEGVMSLMKQAQEEQQKQLGDAHAGRTSPLASVATPLSASGSITEQLYPSVPSFTTPSHHRRTASLTPGVRAPRYNPIYTPQSRMTQTPRSARPKSLIELPSTSTPFKARTPRAPQLTNTNDVTPSSKLVASTPSDTLQIVATPTSSTNKRLSQTASALLSLLEPVGSPLEVAAARAEDRDRMTDPAIKAFVNPYAASSPLASTPARRKQARKESLAGSLLASSRKKRQAIDEIERTMPAEEKVSAFASAVATVTPSAPPSSVKAPESPPQPLSLPSVPSTPKGEQSMPTANGSELRASQGYSSLADRFKPIKSSHLRESIVMSPPESPASNARSPEKKRTPPKPVFSSNLVQPDSPSPAPASPFTFAASSAPKMESTVKSTGSEVSKVESVINRNESEGKALKSNDYKAYVPRFFFTDPTPVVTDSEAARTKAKETAEVMWQDYKHKFMFPVISRSDK